MFAWVLSLMIAVQPNAPWRDTYESTAHAIAKVVAEEEPLFAGELGRERTAAVLVSIAWFESTFNPAAVGDHGRSRGLYQIQGEGELSDPVEATRVALRLVRASFRVCRARTMDERLGWYAAGGKDCERGLRESRHRLLKAKWLVKNRPPPAATAGGPLTPTAVPPKVTASAM
jgi:hypothetical protein